MTDRKIPQPQASAIFDVLVKHAGAHESMRANFCHVLAEGTSEYRFQGTLGFGGKYLPNWHCVTCYREDETPERLETIQKTNAALAQLQLP